MDTIHEVRVLAETSEITRTSTTQSSELSEEGVCALSLQEQFSRMNSYHFRNAKGRTHSTSWNVSRNLSRCKTRNQGDDYEGLHVE